VNVRPATPADLDCICRLEAQTPTAAHWNASQYADLFTPETLTRVALVACNSGEGPVVGFLVARCLPEEWEVENLVVDANARHAGIGSSLVLQLAREAAAAGAASIILEVRESNRRALRLYESIGFKFEGRREGYYDGPTEDALLYRLPLQVCDKIP
jgi:[ribosomal protein S18]-alanine N-acetyltransferase